MPNENKIEKYLRKIIEPVVDYPDELSVSVAELPSSYVIEIDPAENDVGKIIGRHGVNIEAVRRLVKAFCAKISKKVGRVYLNDRYGGDIENRRDNRRGRGSRKRPRRDGLPKPIVDEGSPTTDIDDVVTKQP